MSKILFLLVSASCFAVAGEKTDPSAVATSSSSAATCSYAANTTNTATVNTYGCAVRTRDTSGCQTDRTNAGLSGYWLKFSCRVNLGVSGSNVTVTSDGLPDTTSSYFATTDTCYEAFTSSERNNNPNSIAAQNIIMTVPSSPSTAAPSNMALGVVGLAVNGVAIYSNEAAPGDSIYAEVATFDQCDGHPDNSSVYHYHIEPSAVTQSGSEFVGVMRDGFPVYGRLDADGSTPTLDANGGHTGTTPDSNGASVYHYHVHLQTSGSDSAYFITAGKYRGNGWFMYWLLGTILSFIGPYDQGKPPINGVHIKYHRTGNPYRIALFLDGKQEFKEIRWYSDGSLWSVIDFSNGVYDGAHRSWYPNGKVRYLKYYKNGIRHGEEWGWHANGVLSDHHVFFWTESRFFTSLLFLMEDLTQTIS